MSDRIEEIRKAFRDYLAARRLYEEGAYMNLDEQEFQDSVLLPHARRLLDRLGVEDTEDVELVDSAASLVLDDPPEPSEDDPEDFQRTPPDNARRREVTEDVPVEGQKVWVKIEGHWGWQAGVVEKRGPEGYEGRVLVDANPYLDEERWWGVGLGIEWVPRSEWNFPDDWQQHGSPEKEDVDDTLETPDNKTASIDFDELFERLVHELSEVYNQGFDDEDVPGSDWGYQTGVRAALDRACEVIAEYRQEDAGE